MIEIIEVKSGDSMQVIMKKMEDKFNKGVKEAKAAHISKEEVTLMYKKESISAWEEIFGRKVSEFVNAKGMLHLLDDKVSLEEFTNSLTGFAIAMQASGQSKVLANAVDAAKKMIPVPEAASFEEELEADSDEDDDWMADEVTIKGNSPKPVRKSCENIRIIRRNTLINGRYTSKAQAEKVINGMCLHTCDSLKDFKIVSVLFE